MKTWTAREITIVASLAIHVAVGFAALNAAHEKKKRRATTVALADQKKPEKKPEPPKPPPPAPPKPKAAAPKVAPAAAPAPSSAPPPVAAAAAAPVATDIAMSNEVGMDMGTGQKQHDETKPAAIKPKPGAAPVKTPVHVDEPPPSKTESGACTEPPGKPVPSTKSEIEYTEEARAAGIEGRLLLEVTVDESGNVTDVKVITGVDPALDAAAIATVKTWKFKPALACGKPVAGGTYRIARRFELGD
ncbi:MAG: TonB family protein [Deltaproteobacteria bacterium]|nr:TonB family protein [Deltaproteobacteria bacterium]